MFPAAGKNGSRSTQGFKNWIPGVSLDLTTCDGSGTPWDFAIAERRRAAEQLLDEQEPMLLVGSPVRTAFSSWQCINNLNRDATTTY